MTKPKPKRTEREQEFLDMSAIHLMGTFPYENGVSAEARAAYSFECAEALLAERNKRT